MLEADDNITLLIGQRKPYHHPPFSLESVTRAANVSLRPTDVFIVTAPKSGTTWLQQLCHQLRTGGDMKFPDIYCVSPWDQMAWDIGQDVDDPAFTIGGFRLFKTHLPLSSLARGGKYLATLRDPQATYISWYQFLCSKAVPSVLAYRDVSDFVMRDGPFVKEGMRFGATLFEYYLEFWKCRHLPQVCVVVFEDLQADLLFHLAFINRFIATPASFVHSNESLLRVADMGSKAFMSRHVSAFDESWAFEQACKLGRMADASSFAPVSRVNLAPHRDQLSAEACAELKSRWHEEVTAKGGPTSYEELVADVRAANAAKTKAS
jgi:hypothetical protein